MLCSNTTAMPHTLTHTKKNTIYYDKIKQIIDRNQAVQISYDLTNIVKSHFFTIINKNTHLQIIKNDSHFCTCPQLFQHFEIFHPKELSRHSPSRQLPDYGHSQYELQAGLDCDCDRMKCIFFLFFRTAHLKGLL